jgi:hypothetical protein
MQPQGSPADYSQQTQLSYMPRTNIMKSDYNLTIYVVLFRVEFETLFRLHLRNVQI